MSFLFLLSFWRALSWPFWGTLVSHWVSADRDTADMPSTNFVLNRTLALVNMPSFRDTTINCREKVEYNYYKFVLIFFFKSKVCCIDLWVSEMTAQHLPNVLCVRKIQSSIHLIQDVDWSWFEQQHGQNEGQGHQWPEISTVCLQHNVNTLSNLMILSALLIICVHEQPQDTQSPISTDLCPPLSSLRFSFQVLPKATLNSRPSNTPQPCGGASLALAPGSRVEKMEPKSLFTYRGRVSLTEFIL